MKSSLRRLLTLCLAAAVFYACAPRAVASDAARARTPAGELVTNGRVLLDGAEAISGVSFFSGSEVQTEPDASALLILGALCRTELRPQSALRLGLGDGEVSASLGLGGVRLSKSEGVAAVVNTGSGSVSADREGAAIFTVTYDAGRTTVETKTGRVRLRLGEKEVLIAAGERYAEGQDAGSKADDEGLSGKEKAGIILGIGGAVALLFIILAVGGEDDEPVISPSR